MEKTDPTDYGYVMRMNLFFSDSGIKKIIHSRKIGEDIEFIISAENIRETRQYRDDVEYELLC